MLYLDLDSRPVFTTGLFFEQVAGCRVLNYLGCNIRLISLNGGFRCRGRSGEITSQLHTCLGVSGLERSQLDLWQAGLKLACSLITAQTCNEDKKLVFLSDGIARNAACPIGADGIRHRAAVCPHCFPRQFHTSLLGPIG